MKTKDNPVEVLLGAAVFLVAVWAICAIVGFVVTRIPPFKHFISEPPTRWRWERLGEYAGAGVLAICFAALGVMAFGSVALLVKVVLGIAGIIESLTK